MAISSQVLNSQQINGVTYPGRQIYDYTTCSGANLGNPCQPFINNQIPAARLDAFTQSYLTLFPKATRQSQAYQNLDYTLSAPVNNDLYSVRVDQSLGKSNKLYGTFAQADMPVADLYSYGPLYTNNFGSTKTHYARLVETWAINADPAQPNQFWLHPPPADGKRSRQHRLVGEQGRLAWRLSGHPAADGRCAVRPHHHRHHDFTAKRKRLICR